MLPASGNFEMIFQNDRRRKPEDLEWKRFVVKVIRQTRATVLPLYIHGRNSRLFHLAAARSA